MELIDFLQELQSDIRAEITDRTVGPYPFPSLVFAEKVMQHMCDIGMTFDPVVCHWEGRIGNAGLRITGYALSDDEDQLDLFVSLYEGTDIVVSIPEKETKTAAEQCLRFLKRCVQGNLAAIIEPSDDAHALALVIKEHYPQLEQIRIYVLTDRSARQTRFVARDIAGKTVMLEVMDIARLHRHLSEGKPRDEITADFADLCGGPLPCVSVPGYMTDYDYALAAIPAEALRVLYEKYGGRLLEANVRSFLSGRGKVNQGISATLRGEPGRFMAYNNGIVLVADEAKFGRCADDSPGLAWLRGMQVVNGGQTTASIYFTKKRNPEIDLSHVRVPAKIIILNSCDDEAEEALISAVSRFANSQNAVRQSDLSANRPFHVQLEKLSETVYCPDGRGRWFYERAAGSYNTMLAREGTTPARLKELKRNIPTSRKLTKPDIAKYLNCWDQNPHLVSLGAQKNFAKYMENMTDTGDISPDPSFYKRMIAKAILFKNSQLIIRKMFPAFQGNVVVYVVSIIANRLGDRLDLDRIWQNQVLSLRLQEQIRAWGNEVNDVLHRSAHGRMISEWAKKEECWSAVRGAVYSSPFPDIPEVRPDR